MIRPQTLHTLRFTVPGALAVLAAPKFLSLWVLSAFVAGVVALVANHEGVDAYPYTRLARLNNALRRLEGQKDWTNDYIGSCTQVAKRLRDGGQPHEAERLEEGLGAARMRRMELEGEIEVKRMEMRSEEARRLAGRRVT